ARQRVVLYGGSLLSGTWEWDGTDWTQRSPAPSPQWRRGHAMAYDAARQRTVMFEGSDTWEWDGNDWSRRAATASPPPRTSAMAYDAARQRVVLFGGRDAGFNCVADTWEWDGSNWAQRSPATSPGARWGHA